MLMQQLHPSQPRPLCPATVSSREDYRDDKLQRRREYVFTDQIDPLSYLSHQDLKKRPGIPQLAKKVGVPHWALKKRARELGLARTKRVAMERGGVRHSVPVCVDER